MVLFQITLPYACAGVETETLHPYATIVRAAPIFKWMLGKSFNEIEAWVVKKHGTITMVAEIPIIRGLEHIPEGEAKTLFALLKKEEDEQNSQF